MTTSYVIIGAGAASMSAVETLRARDAHASITIIGEEPHKFYSRPGLAYVLDKTIPEKQLAVRTMANLRALHLNWIHARATQILPQGHAIALADGRWLQYDRALIATGSLAVPPDFPGGNFKGVVKLDNLEDVRAIEKLAQVGRTAVVIGGGITALELVEGLRVRGMRVHYFLRGDRYWSNVLDETESRIVEERLRAEGVMIHYHTQVRQAIGKNGWVIGVETMDGATVPCHLLAVAVGVRPRMELTRTAGLPTDRGILVDEYLQTSVPDIFAAGDVAQVFDPRSRQSVLDTLWSTALAQGCAAGANMTGARTPYVKEVALNVTRLAGLTTTIIGSVGGGRDEDLITIARGDSETWRIAQDAWSVADRQDVNRVRVLMNERTVVGALVMGDQTLSRPLYTLIANQTDVSPIRDAIHANPHSLGILVQQLYQQQTPA